jgi:cell division protein FtsW (lipid II flippase)
LRLLSRLRFTELQLLIVPSAMTIVGLLTIYLASTRDLDWDWRDIWVSLAFMGVVIAMSLVFSISGFAGDQVIFPVTVAISGLGLLVIQRLAPALEERGGEYASLARNQLIYLAIGMGLLLGIITFVRRIGWLRRYKYTWAFAAIALMVLTMLVGRAEYGARLWLQIGPFSIQTSEIAKVAMVVFLAGYLAENQELIVSTYRVGPLRLPPIPYLMPMLLMWAFSMLVVVAQNDLGTALLFFGVFLAMLYLASGKLSYVLAGLAAFAVGVWAAYQLFDRISLRVANWIDPWSDPLVDGYQQVQSEYALAAGKLFGTGLAQGRPDYIPAVHSDYVFSAIGEELGLLGTVGVLLLFMLLIARGFLISLHARDAFGRYLAAGMTTILALQTLIIVGGTVRLMPLTGITLPFVSAGGSSLLTNFIIIGLLMRISNPRAAG